MGVLEATPGAPSSTSGYGHGGHGGHGGLGAFSGPGGAGGVAYKRRESSPASLTVNPTASGGGMGGFGGAAGYLESVKDGVRAVAGWGTSARGGKGN